MKFFPLVLRKTIKYLLPHPKYIYILTKRRGKYIYIPINRHNEINIKRDKADNFISSVFVQVLLQKIVHHDVVQ